MKVNWFYVLIGVLFCLMMFITVRYFKGTGHASIGIAYAEQYKIKAEKAAVVTAVKVVPGQQIKKGQLLVELSSSELEMELEKLKQKIGLLQSEQNEKRKSLSSKIALINAETGVKIEELNTEIAEAESDLRLNKALTQNFEISRDSSADLPVAQKIKLMKQQRSRHEEAIGVKVSEIVQENTTEQLILENQIKLLNRELDLLEEQKRILNKHATADGVVESVFVREGEHVNSYGDLLAINPLHPSSIVGYLVGKKQPLPVGSTVKIAPFERSNYTTEGRVIGYGSVVQLPEILQKSTAVKAFGREVFIETLNDNELAAGEKVLIK